jgi:hypothetical protein
LADNIVKGEEEHAFCGKFPHFGYCFWDFQFLCRKIMK